MIFGLHLVGWLGVRWWVWIYFLFSVFVGLGIGIYWKREALKRIYYTTRFPERTIRVIIHYKSSMYNIYWRLIPDNNLFKINNKVYEFNDNEILRENDFFSTKDKREKTIINIKGNKYEFEDLMLIKQKGVKYPEIHYFYNNPKPLSFDFTNENLNFTGKQMSDFEQNDLFTKLLRLNQERNTLLILILICAFDCVINLFTLAKMMGWIK